MADDKDVKNEQDVTAEKQKQVEAANTLKTIEEALSGKRKQSLKDLQDQAKIYDALGKSDDAKILRATNALAIEEEKLRVLKEQIDAGEVSGEEAMKLLKLQAAQVEEADHLLKKLNNATEAIREGRVAAKELGDTLSSGLVGGDLMSIFNVKTMKNMMKAFRGGSASIGSFVKSLGVGLLTSFVQKLIEVAIAADQAESDFKRATGAGDKMARSMTENYEQTRLYGVELKEMSAAMESLHGTYTDFTMLNKSARDEVSKTGAMLAEVGFKNEDFAKSMQTSTKAFGQTAEGAAAAARDIADFATIIGVAPQQLGADFANMGGSLAKMGDQGIRAFKDLAIVSKTTGLEMSKILAITDKFDTFEGAAEQAGKLNAALGGNFVNAMDLMMATDPAERFGMIRDSILDTGLTFDDMSYYQRKFYTDALGLSDVSDLAGMLSGDMSNLEGATRKSSAEYAKLAKRTKDIQSITEQFKTLMIEMIPIMTEMVDDIRDWMKSLTKDPKKIAAIKKEVRDLAEGLLWLGKKIIWAAEHWYILLGAWAAFKAAGFLMTLKTISGSIAAVGTSTVVASGEVTASGGAIAGTIKTIGTAATASAKGLLALGGSVLMIGGGFYLAALGAAELVKSFMGLGDAAPWAAIGLIGFTVAFMGLMYLLIGLVAGPQAVAVAGAIGVLWAVGGAALLIGGAVALAALGIGEMAKGLAVMFSAMDPAKMLSFTLFVGALVWMAPAMAASAYTLGILGVAILAFAAVLTLAPTGGMEKFTQFFNSVASIDTTNMKLIAEGIRKVNTELTALPEKKTTALSATMAMATTTAAVVGMSGTAALLSGVMDNAFSQDRKSREDKEIKVKVELGDLIVGGQKMGSFVKNKLGEVTRDGARNTN
jgi:hypothetical protein